MAAATIPAIFGRSTAAPHLAPGPRKNTVRPIAAGIQDVRPSQVKEARPPVARMLPEEPELQQVHTDRAAAVAEQKALADLAARCLAADAQAWEQLARSQHRRVYGICYRFTGSQSDAEDLTQEVFLKMYRNLASFDPAKGGLTTWITTLTRNLLVDNYRRNRLERASDSLDESFDGEEDGPSKADRLADSGKTQEQLVSGLQLRAQIQDALSQVSPDLREAVILRDLEDMDYKEIAEILGVPQGTVKSRISRGRSELARLLKRIEGQVM
ncbi:MAG: sigma-70 family RNA polymerase sigma factor [Acidobacteria bacterium]|nr:sigma-70 family RNA polymerase sigma factor [Acidobacteriota bacterium]